MSGVVPDIGSGVNFPWPCPICNRLSSVVTACRIERGDPVSEILVTCECPACELDGQCVEYDIAREMTADELRELDEMVDSAKEDGLDIVDIINCLLETGGRT